MYLYDLMRKYSGQTTVIQHYGETIFLQGDREFFEKMWQNKAPLSTLATWERPIYIGVIGPVEPSSNIISYLELYDLTWFEWTT